MKRESIQTKILSTIGLISVMVFSFVILYLHFYARPANEENVLFLIRQNVETKAQEVNQWIEKRIVEYRTLAVIPAIRSMDTRLITPIIEQVTNAYRLNDQTMETFSFIGKNGFCWINAQATENLIRYDDYMKVYESDAEFLIGEPLVNESNREVVVFYYAIKGYTGKKESLIASAVPLFRIKEIVNTLQLYDSKTWIINSEHNIITSDPDYIAARYIDPKILNELDISSYNDSTIIDVMANNGKAKLIISPISSYSDWKLMTLVDCDAINQPINNVMQGALWVLILLLILIVILGWYLSKEVLRPISRLQQCMNQVQQGNLKCYYPVNSSNDEIKQLGSSYNLMIDELAQSMDAIVMEQTKLRNAELKTLQEQIKPHFLYNTLDNIRWMAKKHGADNVVKAISDLSTYFRLSLNNGKTNVTIKEEFVHMKSYLDIQKMRYGDKFSYLIELDPQIESLYITKIVLQPIVENAINHGIKNCNKNGTVQVSGKLVGENVILTVEDDGIGMDAVHLDSIKNGLLDEQSSHYGLRNVYQRLLNQCENGVQFDIESWPNIGTKVTITMKRKDLMLVCIAQ